MSRNQIIAPEVIKALPILKLLSRLSTKQRNNLLQTIGGDPILFNALKEIISNYLNGYIKLEKSNSKDFSKQKKKLQKFFCDKTAKCQKKRRALVKQTGGFLPILIPAAATLIEFILKKALNKNE